MADPDTVTTTDPRTGKTTATQIAVSTAADVDRIVAAAERVWPFLAAYERRQRAAMLDAVADAIEASRHVLLETAWRETGLSRPRLDGEITRSAFQFRMFGDVLRDGGYLEATIDHADPVQGGASPDLRRMLIPLGPVAVFGASNFPFAFSVLGGDTASALAAGCPVVVKAHESHPLTSQASIDVLRSALAASDMPEEAAGIVYGQDAGRTLVAHPLITAVGFTGSLHAAKALTAIIAERNDPIPFYGELSSVNPLVVSPGAAAARGPELAEGLFASFTGSAGQLCTKPGVAFVPCEATDLIERLVSLAAEAPPQHLLNERVLRSYGEISTRTMADGGARPLVSGAAAADGFAAAPTILALDARDLTEAATEEAFGPLLVLVRYSSLDEVLEGLDVVPRSLTATLHSEPDERELRARFVERTIRRAGRLVFDGFPTGVRVCWAQHHGGPWPATNVQHTSVGATAIRRFLRPFVWQDAPTDVLPRELQEECTDIPRRVDGVLRLAAGDEPR